MTPTENDDPKRLARNWDELLQELRVTQTGVQILTGFLLTVPFTPRFEDLTDFQRDLYLFVLAGSVMTTAFVVAPVAFHRILFRRRERPFLVQAANQCARIGLLLVAITTSGVLLLVFDVVLDKTAGFVAAAVALAFFLALWVATPLVGAAETPDLAPPEDEPDNPSSDRPD